MTTQFRGRRHAECAALDAALLDAATRADVEGVRTALELGADVNATDSATGHTVVICAIAGDSNWEDVDVSDASFMLPSRVAVLKTILRSDVASLYALNAPAAGVTPLGLAAWLNVPEIIRVLLEESRGLVAVDGTDTLGVIPLMYTARDGTIEAASILLSHGARPDLRDAHYRTAIHHALRHSNLLSLFESNLRKQRMRELSSGNRRQLHPLPQPHAAYVHSFATSSIDLSNWAAPSESILSRSTATLNRAIIAGDMDAIHRILFPATHKTSVLVNRLDSQGWAPLHHCVCAQNPSVELLDALYLAGADTSLYTTSKHGTPLHCLARMAKDPTGSLQSARLHVFVHHLVRELRAPLAATDEEGETCIHVAAEYGRSIEVLFALLACDTHGTARRMKNSRGLTPFEVARPELRLAFGAEAQPRRSSSVASFRTIRPSTSSSTSISSYNSFVTAPTRHQSSPIARVDYPDNDVDASLLARRILENLSMVGQEADNIDALEISSLRDMLNETSQLGELWAHLTQLRIQEAARDLRDARGWFKEADNLLQTVTHELDDSFGRALSDCRDSADRARRRTTDSGDSDSTAVSSRASSLVSRKWRSMSDLRSSTESKRREYPDLPPSPYLTIEEEDELAISTEKPSDRSVLNGLLSPAPKDVLHVPRKLSVEVRRTASPAPSKRDESSSSTAKLKAWFRKKLKFELPEASTETKIILPGDRSPKTPPPIVIERPTTPEILSTARHILSTAGKDLSCVEEGMHNADQFLSLASKLLNQTERRLKMTIVNRHAALESACLAQLQDHLDDPFMSAIASTIRSANHDAVPFPLSHSHSHSHSRPGSDSDYALSLTSSVSAGSSMVSLSDTLIESEDDDVRALRRLMTRKVEARTDGALDEIDRVLAWLRILRDTLRSLRRRTLSSMAQTVTLP